MPVLHASRIYNDPRTTLQHKLSGESPETTEKVGPECFLENEVENELGEWIKNLSKMVFPINKENLAFSVKQILTNLNIINKFKNDK